MQYNLIQKYLEVMTEDQTTVVESGSPSWPLQVQEPEKLLCRRTTVSWSVGVWQHARPGNCWRNGRYRWSDDGWVAGCAWSHKGSFTPSALSLMLDVLKLGIAWWRGLTGKSSFHLVSVGWVGSESSWNRKSSGHRCRSGPLSVETRHSQVGLAKWQTVLKKLWN